MASKRRMSGETKEVVRRVRPYAVGSGISDSDDAAVDRLSGLLAMIPARPVDRSEAFFAPIFGEYDFKAIDVPELDREQPIRFAFSPTQRRCVPIGTIDAIDDGRRYDTLQDCRTSNLRRNVETKADAVLPEELERLIGEWVGYRDLVHPENKANIDIAVPTAAEELAQSIDVAQYYANGRPDIVLRLLKAGYGVSYLTDLLTQMMISQPGQDPSPIDFQIYNLVVNNPSWLNTIAPVIRIVLWYWGIVNLLSLLGARGHGGEGKRGGQIDWKQFDQGVRLLTENVLVTSPDAVSMLTLLGERLKDQVDAKMKGYLLQTVLDNIELLTFNSPSDRTDIVDTIIGLYDAGTCIENYGHGSDDALMDVIERSAEINKYGVWREQDLVRIRDLQRERVLQKLMVQLQAANSSGDESGGSTQARLMEQIDTLVAQGVGRCYLAANATGATLKVAKKILYPIIRRFNSRPDQGNYTESVQLRVLLRESTIEDIREVVSILTDPSVPPSRTLLDEIIRHCDTESGWFGEGFGCRVIGTLAREQIRLLDALPPA